MREDKSLFDRLKERGEEVFGQISGELMQNEHFMKAMQGALEGKQRIDHAVGRALKTMNLPTRSELKRATSRIDALEAEVAELKEELQAAARARSAPARPAAGRGGKGGAAKKPGASGRKPPASRK